MSTDTARSADHQVPGREQVTGVILAGGMARRMGGQDKGLVDFAGRPLVEWVLAALTPQVGGILINANRNHARYAGYGHLLVADAMKDYQGPLAGFACALAASPTPWIVTVPCDGPYLAPDLVARLTQALAGSGSDAGAGAELAVASDGHRLQPVYALLPRTLVPSLATFLAAGERKIDRWYAQHRIAIADFSDCPDCFANINSPADVVGPFGEHAGGRAGDGAGGSG